MPLEPGPHADELLEAIRLEGDGQRRLLEGDQEGAALLLEAADHYRRSWELAPPRSFGRLVGMVKAAVIAGDADDAARYVAEAVGEPDSPPSWYAAGIAALVLGDDARALDAATGMRAGSPAFGRAAAGIEALADRDAEAYAAAVRAVVEDFEGRDEHLTGVPIADTALMLERLAEARGLAARPESALLP